VGASWSKGSIGRYSDRSREGDGGRSSTCGCTVAKVKGGGGTVEGPTLAEVFFYCDPVTWMVHQSKWGNISMEGTVVGKMCCASTALSVANAVMESVTHQDLKK
jgi:hypothetical protein